MLRKLLTTAALFISATAFAVTMERVETIDGSVYDGYIYSQVPGSYIEINADRACVMVSLGQLSYHRTLAASSFDRNALQAIHDSFGVQEFYNVAIVEIGENHFDNAVIFPKDDRLYALIMEKNRYRIGWNELYKTKKISSGKRITKDILVLKDASYLEGQVFEQVIGKSISFIPDADKDKLVEYNASDLYEIRTVFYDNTKSVWNQTEYYDVVTLRDSTVLEGFILSRRLGDSVTMLDRGNKELTLNVSLISAYKKIVVSDNYDYSMAGMRDAYYNLSETAYSTPMIVDEHKEDKTPAPEIVVKDETPVKKSSKIVVHNGNARFLPVKKNKKSFYIQGLPLYSLSVGDKVEFSLRGTDSEGTGYDNLIIIRTRSLVLDSKLSAMLRLGYGERVQTFTKKDIKVGMAPCEFKRNPFEVTFTEPGVYAVYPYSKEGEILVFSVK